MKKLIAFLTVLVFGISAASASPGAHGPNGEHLDKPGGTVQSSSAPRVESFTESFELVGKLQGGELSILIDRYETNEPVLNGTLEVEAGGRKATAKFHADFGDYSVDDVKFLQLLRAPGKHALVFTLTAGDESDLLEGTLEVAAEEPHHDGGHSPMRWAAAAALLAALSVGAAVVLRRRKSPK